MSYVVLKKDHTSTLLVKFDKNWSSRFSRDVEIILYFAMLAQLKLPDLSDTIFNEQQPWFLLVKFGSRDFKSMKFYR